VKALIHVTLKKDVLDPQGKAIRNACVSLGYDNVEEVRQGKFFEVRLTPRPGSDPRALCAELCEKLLANPVIEDYAIVSVEEA
jgi:phosphoribosylformylglycinamidine synthase